MATELIAREAFTPRGCAYNKEKKAWEGGEYVSGTLSDAGLTQPEQPISVKTKAYADELVKNGLAREK